MGGTIIRGVQWSIKYGSATNHKLPCQQTKWSLKNKTDYSQCLFSPSVYCYIATVLLRLPISLYIVGYWMGQLGF